MKTQVLWVFKIYCGWASSQGLIYIAISLFRSLLIHLHFAVLIVSQKIRIFLLRIFLAFFFQSIREINIGLLLCTGWYFRYYVVSHWILWNKWNVFLFHSFCNWRSRWTTDEDSEWYPSQTRFQTQPFLTSKPMFLFYHPVKKHFIFKTLSIWFIFFSISVLNLGKAEMDWHIYPPFLLTPHLNEYKGMKHTNWRKWRNWDRLKRGQEQNPAK